MSQQELLKRLALVLDAAQVEYMLTGSIVSSLQGEPRSTHDIDVVVSLPANCISTLVRAFPPPDFYLDEADAASAIDSGGMFNLLDVREGEKVDFWVLTDEPFDQMRFSRRYTQDLGAVRISVSQPEDTILMKLKWAKMSGGSEKQFTDALRVYEVQFGQLDIDYLQHWAGELDVADLLARLKAEAEFP
jgi:hypothetical protein